MRSKFLLFSFLGVVFEGQMLLPSLQINVEASEAQVSPFFDDIEANDMNAQNLSNFIGGGSIDLDSQECEQFEKVKNIIANVNASFNASKVAVPTIVKTEALLNKYGDGEKKLMLFGDSDGEGIRYDLTVPLVMKYIKKGNTGRKVWALIDKVFRKEKIDNGHYREFSQCEFDIFGTDELIDDAQVMSYAYTVLSQVGINDFTIRYNNRKIFPFLAKLVGDGTPEAILNLQHSLDAIDKANKGKFWTLDILLALCDSQYSRTKIQKLAALFIIPIIPNNPIESIDNLLCYCGKDEQANTALQESKKVLQYLPPEVLKHVQLDLTLARGADYYYGSCFEVVINGVDVGAVFGGGRFNILGVKGVGGAFGLERLFLVMHKYQLLPQINRSSVLLTGDDAKLCPYHIFSALSILRKNGVSADYKPNAEEGVSGFSHVFDLTTMRFLLLPRPESPTVSLVQEACVFRKQSVL